MRAALLAALLAVGFCRTADAAKVTFGVTGSASTVTAFYAADHDLFAKHGIDIIIQIVKEGSTTITGLVAGDFQVAGPTGTVFLQAVDSGLDLLVLQPQFVFPTPTALGILARTGGPIGDAPTAIGHRIGVPGRGGLQDILTHDWLAQSNVDASRVTFVELSFAQMADALRTGQVDAVSANDPVFDRIVNEKLAAPIFDLRTLVPAGAVGGVYNTTREYAKAHPAEIAAIRAAMSEAIDDIRKDKEGAKASILRFTKLPPDVMKTMEIPSLSANLDPKQLDFWIELMIKQGLLSHHIEAGDLIAK